MAHDLRHAFRVLLGRPGFTALAVATLALGIGANAAMFAVVHGVLLRPLPYPAPERIVHLWEQTGQGARISVSNPNFLDWRERAGSFAAIAAYAGGRETVLGGLEPVFASVHAVSDGFFRVFGIAAAIGRTFGPEEMRLNGAPAVVVSHGFWERSLGSNPALETLQLRIAGLSCRVVGVMPAGFAFPSGAEVWIPRELFEDTSTRTAHNYSVVARLNDGVELSQARAEMNTIAGALRRENAGQNDAAAVTMLPLQDALTGAARHLLLTLLGAVGLVLLIACANVASMLLAQGEERRAELAVRAALGAGRFRIVRQLVVENTVIAAAGTGAGLLLAAWLVPALRAMQGSTLPRLDTIGIDGAVLMFTAAMGFLTPLVFGLLPSIQVSRTELRDAMADGGRSSASPARARVRSALVAAEVAVALVLLVGSALLIRTFWNVVSVDAGFDSRGVVTAEMAVPSVKYPDAPRAAAFYAGLLPQLRAVPGVRAAGAINQLPLSGTDFGGGFRFEGSDEVRYAGYRVASDGYFDAMGIALRRGRVIGPEDRPGRAPVAIVNEAFVRQYVGAGDPLGRRFAYLGMDPLNPTFTIVGVIADVHHQALVRDARPEVYVAYRQQPFRSRWTMTVAVRADRPELAGSLVPALRARIRALDAEVPVRFSTLDAVVSQSIADRRFMMAVLTAFAGLALMLAAVGIYGVLAYAVARRTHEIGIRMALGAAPGSVAGLLLRGGMAAVGVGTAAGLAGAFAATRALETFLFGVRPLDPLSIAAAVAALGAAAWIGGCIPARRATRVDPLVALRTR
jgi:putative ABC transport system permease protein